VSQCESHLAALGWGVTLFLEKETYWETKRRLIGLEMDGSDLVTSLLRNWVEQFRLAAPSPRTTGEKA
jgi:hypothetical protein